MGRSWLVHMSVRASLQLNANGKINKYFAKPSCMHPKTTPGHSKQNSTGTQRYYVGRTRHTETPCAYLANMCSELLRLPCYFSAFLSTTCLKEKQNKQKSEMCKFSGLKVHLLVSGVKKKCLTFPAGIAGAPILLQTN